MLPLLQSTSTALGGEDLPQCESRSLRLTRYARPDLNDKTAPTRKAYLAAVVRAPRELGAARSLIAWQASLPFSRQVHARLQGRLLVNVSGSVMENAGLLIDRYGVSYVPGSAVKGCARRAALAALRQWCEVGDKPSAADILTRAAAPFAKPVDLLIAILRVFGCTDLEWQAFDKEDETGNDLAWACAQQWNALRDDARARLASLPATAEDAAPKRRGSVAFLPAYPAKTPASDLELDVLTPHHKEYYESTDVGRVALDTEDPVPVFFPAVAAGADYAFTLVSLDHAESDLLSHAETWLSVGLGSFGLGAKTAAGYGWFEDVTKLTNERIAAEEAKVLEERKAREEEDRRLAALAARKAREAELAALAPEQRADAELAGRAADWGWMKQHLTRFDKHTAADQAAILRWFCGAGKERWINEIKSGAQKGKKPWSQIIGAINLARKNHQINLP